MFDLLQTGRDGQAIGQGALAGGWNTEQQQRVLALTFAGMHQPPANHTPDRTGENTTDT